MKKSKHTKLLRWLGAVAISIIVVGIVGVLYVRTDYRFYVKNTWYQLTNHLDIKIISIEDEVVEYTEEQIQQMPEFTYNSSLVLANKDHPIPSSYEPNLTEYKESGVYMDECMVAAYKDLSDSINTQFSQNLYVISSFRTYEDQVKTYEKDATVAAIPGASEHQLGLALDVYVKNYSGYGFIKTPPGQFVNMKCWNYGFIIRYPYGKTHTTGIVYEPWHIRYVGMPHAEAIYKNAITLEEYIEKLKVGEYYQINDYIVSRQPRNNIRIPKNMVEVTISPDNLGNCIITGKLNN